MAGIGAVGGGGQNVQMQALAQALNQPGIKEKLQEKGLDPKNPEDLAKIMQMIMGGLPQDSFESGGGGSGGGCQGCGGGGAPQQGQQGPEGSIPLKQMLQAMQGTQAVSPGGAMAARSMGGSMGARSGGPAGVK